MYWRENLRQQVILARFRQDRVERVECEQLEFIHEQETFRRSTAGAPSPAAEIATPEALDAHRRGWICCWENVGRTSADQFHGKF